MDNFPLAEYGVIGLVLAWFMFRNEKAMAGLTKSINNNNLVMIHFMEIVSGCPNNLSNESKKRQEMIDKIKKDSTLIES